MIQSIQNRRIAPTEPAYIVAEIGSNWHTLEHCLHAITISKACGADAVKFQLYTGKELYGYDVKIPGEMPFEWIEKLKIKADAVGIHFLCSAFSPEGIIKLDSYVPAHKIASSENSHIGMLAVANDTKKPILLSCGSTNDVELKSTLRYFEHVKPILMYCSVAYPSFETDPRVVEKMTELYPENIIGFSDHSLDYLTIPRAAFDLGACVIEKHLNTEYLSDTPDASHSLKPDQFKRMVSVIRGTDVPTFGHKAEEQEAVLTHRRRLKALRDIQPGETLAHGENFGIYRMQERCLYAFGPHQLPLVAGKTAKHKINALDGIGPGDIV